MKLRPYQEDIKQGVYDALQRGVTRPAVVMATGLGKTVVFSDIIGDFIIMSPRILVLCHRDELAGQAASKIHGAIPGVSFGIVKASQNDVGAQVIIGSVQTLQHARRREQIRGVGLIIVDEAHHAAARTWRETLRHFGAFDGVPTIGFTATMEREGDLGLGEIWQEVVTGPSKTTYDTVWGIKHRYLARPRGKRIQVPRLDFNGVHVRGGDLVSNEIGDRLLNADAGPAITKAIQEHADDLPFVIFAPNVETANDFSECNNDAGIATEVITAKTSVADRWLTFERFRTGHTRGLANVGVLTEGWDAPWAKCAIIARPTKSRALYQQMIGRVLRPWQNQDALILDVVGSTTKHDLASLIDLSMDRETEFRDAPDRKDSDDELFDFYDDFDTGSSWKDQQAPAELVTTDVDLFDVSRNAWLTTPGGVMFIPAGDDLVFLYPDQQPGTYLVGITSASRPEVALPILGGVSIEQAVAHAEQTATMHDPTLSARGAEWRKKPATAAQYRQRDVRVPPGSTQGQAADLISIARAHRRLDR